MAHFVKMDGNQCEQVIVVANKDCGGGVFPDSESIGQAFIASLGLEGTWLQCSYNGSFRGCYPGAGYTYDEDLDCFVAPEIITS
jgi:hypothetical protein